MVALARIASIPLVTRWAWLRERWVSWCVAAVLLALLPKAIQNTYYITLAINVMITLLLTLSLNLVCGFSGQFSLAHAAFFGIGAYIPAILASRLAISPWLGLPIGVGVVLAVAGAIGVPVVKLRGYYLAIASLSFAIFVEVVVREAVDVTGGAYGIQRLPPLELFGHALRGGAYYEVALLALLTTMLLLDNIIRSPFGRAIIAIRDNPSAASATGINVAQVRLLVFVLSAGVAAVAGWVHAFYYLLLNPMLLSAEWTFVWLFMVLIGGLGHVPGVVLGTLLLTIGPELLGFATEHQALSSGLLMIFVALFIPRGLGGLIDDLFCVRRLSKFRE
jgi:branched-chain amino acid transport system permease protein